MLMIFRCMSLFETDKLHVLHNCLTAIKDWMANNFLKLNTDKTDVLIIASRSIASMVAHCIGSLSSAVQSNPIPCITTRTRDDYSGFFIIPAGLLQFPYHLPQQVIPGPSTNGPEPCCKTVDQVQQEDSHHIHLTIFTLASHPVKDSF